MVLSVQGLDCFIRNHRTGVLEQSTLTATRRLQTPKTPQMTVNGLDATTPQLKVIENLVKAYLSLDLRGLEPLTSKDFKFQTFPKIADLPDETAEGHLEKYQPMLSLLTKAEVRIQHHLRAHRLTSTIPRSIFTK